MQDCKTYIAMLMFFLLLFMHVQATVKLPKVIGSNMVLQRNKPVSIFGEASPGEKITVAFGKQVKKTTADAHGKWYVTLDPMTASRKPGKMIITGTDTLTLRNILIGEVWLCSGQSNMEYTMTKSSKYANTTTMKGMTADELKKESNNNIRLFLVKRDLNKPGDVNKGWQPAQGAALGAFSAAGYFFAKKLQEELNVPVGMMASSISGSAIEPWMSGTVEKDTMDTLQVNEELPGKFYAGMIRPLAPFTIKGFLWYQGETNCFLKETGVYSLKFRHLINSWRRLWNDANASFYFVQIAPFNYSKSKGIHQITEETLPAFREAQAAVLDLPQTGMVITTDLVDNLEDIHPTYKWEIGRRLALLALAGSYGKKNITSSGPVIKAMELKENTIEIAFHHAGKGLISKDGKPLNCFTIAGADGQFTKADAVIKGTKVIVSAAGASNPVNVRFAWNESAQPNLFNMEGLPAAPFRTDHLQPATAGIFYKQLSQ